VTALAEAAGVVYAGGDFSTIGGEPRDALAAIDAVTGEVALESTRRR
jgi:hypothetical protein